MYICICIYIYVYICIYIYIYIYICIYIYIYIYIYIFIYIYIYIYIHIYIYTYIYIYIYTYNIYIYVCVCVRFEIGAFTGPRRRWNHTTTFAAASPWIRCRPFHPNRREPGARHQEIHRNSQEFIGFIGIHRVPGSKFSKSWIFFLLNGT